MRQFTCFLCLFIHRRQSQLPHPPKPQRGCRLYLVPHSISFLILGVCRCLCLARLLNRSGCRFVTFFVAYAESRFIHFSLLDPLTLEPYASIHSAAFSNTQQEYFVPHILAYPFASCRFVFPRLSKPSTASATRTSRLPFSSYLVKIQTAGLSIPIPSPTKKCAKPLCKRHRSFPCFPIVSNLLFHLRSTRRRLAHFSLFISLSLHFVRSVYFTNSSCPSVGLRGFLPFVRLKPYSVGFAEGSFSSF